MPHRTLQQGIDTIRAGNLVEGSRLLKMAIKNEALSNPLRAIAYLWLAETKADDIEFRISCYNNAVRCDPSNAEIQKRLSSALTQRLPLDKGSMPAINPAEDSQPYIPINPPPQQMSDSQRINPITQQSSDPQRISPLTQIRRGTGSLSSPSQGAPNPPQQGGFPPQPTPTPPQRGGSQPMAPFDPFTQPPVQRGGSQPMPAVNPQDDPRFSTGQFSPMGGTNSAQYTVQNLYHVVGILNGANGTATGVVVSQDGIVATTRFAVGSAQLVDVELEPGHRFQAQVVRTFPSLDLALLQLDVYFQQIWAHTNIPIFPDNEQFNAISYVGKSHRGTKRASKTNLPDYWIPTSIQLASITDAGANGMFDSQRYLVGLLTRNASRTTGLVYGLHISKIFQSLNQYVQEKQQAGNTSYCTSCGSISRAPAYGGYYCETCGSVLPKFEETRRFQQPNLEGLYGDNMHRACPNCQARVGYYNGRCLRCGYDVSKRELR